MPLSFSELASLIEPSHAWPIEFEPLPARDAAALETATFRIRTAMLSPLEQWLLSIPRGEIGSESVAAIHGSFADFLMQQQRFGPAKNQFLESLRFQRTPQAQRGALLASIHMTKSRQDLTALRNLVQQTPADASAHAILAEAYSVCGDVAASVTELREALRLDGRLMDAGNRLAWILATAPDQEIRNGPEAFSLARQLCQVVKPARAEYFQTFAAALAEVGNFSAAVETEDVAIKIYNSDGHVHEAHQAQARKSQYARGQAFRDLTLTVETRGNFP